MEEEFPWFGKWLGLLETVFSSSCFVIQRKAAVTRYAASYPLQPYLPPSFCFVFNRLLRNDQILLQCSIFPFPNSNLSFQDFNSVGISNLPELVLAMGFMVSCDSVIQECERHVLLLLSVTSDVFREAPVASPCI